MIEIDTPEIVIHFTPLRQEMVPVLRKQALNTVMAKTSMLLSSLFTLVGVGFMISGALFSGALIVSAGFAELGMLYYLGTAQANGIFAEMTSHGVNNLRSMTISLTGIRELTEDTDVTHFWSKFSSLIVHDKLYVLPFATDQGSLVIPARAFIDKNQATEFVQLAQRGLDNLTRFR
jgi:hypothetical protein